ncbi:MAG TPA: response regulator transcription factor [Polyangiaceae bacterium]|nr:response regulator transcription factor [Polyangiaceae bacterium]
MAARVLVIDDDARLFELLQSYLDENGIHAVHAEDGRRGLDELARGAFDAVLLDVMMPGMDGLEVLRKLRTQGNVPVIMLTAKGDETDRVVGLELGADDYLAKPFSPRELLARLRAVLRRAQPSALEERLTAGDLVVDTGARSVHVGGRSVELTGLELDLLVALLRRAGRVVPRAALLEEAGRSDVTVSERTVDVHISNLRRKIGDRERKPPLIRAVRGIGYVLSRES